MSRAETDQLEARLLVLNRDIQTIESELRTMPDKEGRLAPRYQRQLPVFRMLVEQCQTRLAEKNKSGL